MHKKHILCTAIFITQLIFASQQEQISYFPDNINNITVSHFKNLAFAIPTLLDFQVTFKNSKLAEKDLSAGLDPWINYKDLNDINNIRKENNETYFDIDHPFIPVETFSTLINKAINIQEKELVKEKNWLHQNALPQDFFNEESEISFSPFTKILCSNHTEDITYIAFGDCHGDGISPFEQIKTHINENGIINDNVKFLFCGDFNDRGINSDFLWAFLSFLIIKNKGTNKIILIQGNHENEYFNTKDGFFDEIYMKYEKDIAENFCYNLFPRLYKTLPVEAITFHINKNNEYKIAKFCHGGDEIGTNQNNLITAIEKIYKNSNYETKNFFTYQGTPITQCVASKIKDVTDEHIPVIKQYTYNHEDQSANLIFFNSEDMQFFFSEYKNNIEQLYGLFLPSEYNFDPNKPEKTPYTLKLEIIDENIIKITADKKYIHVLERWNNIKNAYNDNDAIVDFLKNLIKNTYENIVIETVANSKEELKKNNFSVTVSDLLSNKDYMLESRFFLEPIVKNFIANIISTTNKESNSCWADYSVETKKTYIGTRSVSLGNDLLKKLYNPSYEFTFRAHQHGHSGEIMEHILDPEKGHHTLEWDTPVKTMSPSFLNFYGIPFCKKNWPGLNTSVVLEYSPEENLCTSNHLSAENNKMFIQKYPKEIKNEHDTIINKCNDKKWVSEEIITQEDLSEINKHMEKEETVALLKSFLENNFDRLIDNLKNDGIKIDVNRTEAPWNKKARINCMCKKITGVVLLWVIGYILKKESDNVSVWFKRKNNSVNIVT